MSKLEQIVKSEIASNGPMDIGRYMSLCLGHPKYGYYMTRDPFGKDGDFTTAPEVSQMFGEIVGAWIVDVWSKLGSPSRFTLLECGAGRGTLMADVMRVAKAVPEFVSAVEIVLLETSPVLIEKQKEALSDYSPKWISNFSDLKDGCPLIVIGNEFLDALPVHQFVKSDGEMKERLVGLNDNNQLSFGLSKGKSSIDFPLNIKEGDCVEVAPSRNAFVRGLCSYIKSNNGVGLFIDYGYAQSYGDTLQAVKSHEFVDPLKFVGDADVTAHVDFMSLRKICREVDVYECGVVKQADFLRTLGIVNRAERLKQSGSSKQMAAISNDLDRLIGLDQMGKIFKVMAFSSEKMQLAGF